MEYMKYLKALIYIFVPILVLNVLITLLYYFNMIGSNTTNILKLIICIISMLIGGIFIGSKASKKGWLEGIKIGLEIIVIFFIVSFLAFDKGLNGKSIIYYLILLGASMLGSMIGINKRKV